MIPAVLAGLVLGRLLMLGEPRSAEAERPAAGSALNA